MKRFLVTIAIAGTTFVSAVCMDTLGKAASSGNPALKCPLCNNDIFCVHSDVSKVVSEQTAAISGDGIERSLEQQESRPIAFLKDRSKINESAKAIVSLLGSRIEGWYGQRRITGAYLNVYNTIEELIGQIIIRKGKNASTGAIQGGLTDLLSQSLEDSGSPVTKKMRTIPQSFVENHAEIRKLLNATTRTAEQEGMLSKLMKKEYDSMYSRARSLFDQEFRERKSKRSERFYKEHK